jgi:hypothetical protein
VLDCPDWQANYPKRLNGPWPSMGATSENWKARMFWSDRYNRNGYILFFWRFCKKCRIPVKLSLNGVILKNILRLSQAW